MKCYPTDMFTQPDAIEQFKCRINKGVLRNPVRDECKHVFCADCFKEAHAADGKCPVTQEPVAAAAHPAPDVEEQIRKLKIKCKNQAPGSACAWTGSMGDLDPHLAKECPEESVKCENEQCHVNLKRKEMAAHRPKCEWLVKKCQFCDYTANDIEMEEHHNSDCQPIPIHCEKNCIVKHQRRHKDLHDRFNCEKAKHDCYFRNAGCFFTGNWEETGRHSSEAFILHATFLEQKLEHFEVYKKITEQLLEDIKKEPERYKELQKYVKMLDDTEDIEFLMFKGNWDKEFSNKKLVFEEPRLVKSVGAEPRQLLWIDRKFHERHRIVFTVEQYNAENPATSLSVGLARKGVLLEKGKSALETYDRKDYRLFGDGREGAVGEKDLKLKVQAGEDYMLSYDPDQCLLILEQLNMKVEKPEEVSVEFPTEFWEWQPVLVLSGEITVRLMDFNDWNQH